MSLGRVADLDSPPVVGRIYLVPCARLCYGINGFDRAAWWPLIGPTHADGELGVHAEHRHYDPRFLTDRQLSSLMHGEGAPSTGRGWKSVFGTVLSMNGAVTELRDVRRRCLRALRPHPFPNALRPKIAASHVPLSMCLRCPHRGFNLRQVPVRDGLIVCPGHGLVWDAETRQPVTEVPK